MVKKVAHYDLDSAKYAVASVGETREVVVTHKASGRTLVVPTRTEFYGHWKKKEGGRLAEINKGRTSPFSWDEFDYEDIQTQAEPISHILHSAKEMVGKAVADSGADDVKFYIGKGDSFRVERSTILEYKGNRKGSLKPLLMDEVVEYMEKKYKPEVVVGLEADDAVVMGSYGKSNHFIIGGDKDFYGSGSDTFNLNHKEEGIVVTEGFGELWLGDKGAVRGKGRIFKLLQACSVDNSDNYRANCASDVRWGEKSAYNLLSECGNDREAYEMAISIFKMLYPEPKEIVGWRGDTFEIDWAYVFQECMDMCHLHRWDGDYLKIDEIFERLKINPDNVEPWVKV